MAAPIGETAAIPINNEQVKNEAGVTSSVLAIDPTATPTTTSAETDEAIVSEKAEVSTKDNGVLPMDDRTSESPLQNGTISLEEKEPTASQDPVVQDAPEVLSASITKPEDKPAAVLESDKATEKHESDGSAAAEKRSVPEAEEAIKNKGSPVAEPEASVTKAAENSENAPVATTEDVMSQKVEEKPEVLAEQEPSSGIDVVEAAEGNEVSEPEPEKAAASATLEPTVVTDKDVEIPTTEVARANSAAENFEEKPVEGPIEEASETNEPATGALSNEPISEEYVTSVPIVEVATEKPSNESTFEGLGDDPTENDAVPESTPESLPVSSEVVNPAEVVTDSIHETKAEESDKAEIERSIQEAVTVDEPSKVSAEEANTTERTAVLEHAGQPAKEPLQEKNNVQKSNAELTPAVVDSTARPDDLGVLEQTTAEDKPVSDSKIEEPAKESTPVEKVPKTVEPTNEELQTPEKELEKPSNEIVAFEDTVAAATAPEKPIEAAAESTTPESTVGDSSTALVVAQEADLLEPTVVEPDTKEAGVEQTPGADDIKETTTAELNEEVEDGLAPETPSASASEIATEASAIDSPSVGVVAVESAAECDVSQIATPIGDSEEPAMADASAEPVEEAPVQEIFASQEPTKSATTEDSKTNEASVAAKSVEAVEKLAEETTAAEEVSAETTDVTPAAVDSGEEKAKIKPAADEESQKGTSNAEPKAEEVAAETEIVEPIKETSTSEPDVTPAQQEVETEGSRAEEVTTTAESDKTAVDQAKESKIEELEPVTDILKQENPTTSTEPARELLAEEEVVAPEQPRDIDAPIFRGSDQSAKEGTINEAAVEPLSPETANSTEETVKEAASDKVEQEEAAVDSADLVQEATSSEPPADITPVASETPAGQAEETTANEPAAEQSSADNTAALDESKETVTAVTETAKPEVTSATVESVIDPVKESTTPETPAEAVAGASPAFEETKAKESPVGLPSVEESTSDETPADVPVDAPTPETRAVAEEPEPLEAKVEATPIGDSGAALVTGKETVIDEPRPKETVVEATAVEAPTKAASLEKEPLIEEPKAEEVAVEAAQPLEIASALEVTPETLVVEKEVAVEVPSAEEPEVISTEVVEEQAKEPHQVATDAPELENTIVSEESKFEEPTVAPEAVEETIEEPVIEDSSAEEIPTPQEVAADVVVVSPPESSLTEDIIAVKTDSAEKPEPEAAVQALTQEEPIPDPVQEPAEEVNQLPVAKLGSEEPAKEAPAEALATEGVVAEKHTEPTSTQQFEAPSEEQATEATATMVSENVPEPEVEKAGAQTAEEEPASKTTDDTDNIDLAQSEAAGSTLIPTSEVTPEPQQAEATSRDTTIGDLPAEEPQPIEPIESVSVEDPAAAESPVKETENSAEEATIDSVSVEDPAAEESSVKETENSAEEAKHSAEAKEPASQQSDVKEEPVQEPVAQTETAPAEAVLETPVPGSSAPEEVEATLSTPVEHEVSKKEEFLESEQDGVSIPLVAPEASEQVVKDSADEESSVDKSAPEVSGDETAVSSESVAAEASSASQEPTFQEPSAQSLPLSGESIDEVAPVQSEELSIPDTRASEPRAKSSEQASPEDNIQEPKEETVTFDSVAVPNPSANDVAAVESKAEETETQPVESEAITEQASTTAEQPAQEVTPMAKEEDETSVPKENALTPEIIAGGAAVVAAGAVAAGAAVIANKEKEPEVCSTKEINNQPETDKKTLAVPSESQPAANGGAVGTFKEPPTPEPEADPALAALAGDREALLRKLELPSTDQLASAGNAPTESRDTNQGNETSTTAETGPSTTSQPVSTTEDSADKAAANKGDESSRSPSQNRDLFLLIVVTAPFLAFLWQAIYTPGNA